MSYTVDI